MKNFVVIDLDGTLINTLPGMTIASNLMLEHFNYSYRYSEKEVQGFIGRGARRLFLSLVHEDHFDDDLEAKYQYFLKLYEANQYNSEPYETVKDTLIKLNELGIKIIVYSNKPNHILQKLMAVKLNMIDFLYLQGQDEAYPPKPDVTLLNIILDKFNLYPINGLYIGDGYVDFLTSRNIGMDFCFCDYGYCSKEHKLEIVGFKIEKFNEILNYIK